MTWCPPLYMSSFSSLVLCLLGSVPSPLLTTFLSQSVLHLTPVYEANFSGSQEQQKWYQETDPNGATPPQTSLMDAAFTQFVLQIYLYAPHHRPFCATGAFCHFLKNLASLCLPCRQETQPECFRIFFYGFCCLIWHKTTSSLLTFTYPAWNYKAHLCEV